jgi:4a-hydroxytetrahydrobiopterin dehydratase
MAEPLNDEQISEALLDLPGWSHEGDALRRSLEFADFREAVAFIVRVAFEAEQRNHHPEITSVYNRIELALTTHDAGNRVTARDVALAEAIEALL